MNRRVGRRAGTRSLTQLRRPRFDRFLETHVSSANYLVPLSDVQELNTPDLIFHSNISIWEQIIYHTIRYNNNITLDNFLLFEWLPRSPGLYFTDQAKISRSIAEEISDIVDDMVIYNPYGKGSMIDGGIGNIRLKPIMLYEEEYFFCSASSSGMCHEGFPVALPTHIYDRYIDEIKNRGASFCTIKGQLKFIPKELSILYQHYTNIPQLYLLVEEISEPSKTKRLFRSTLDVSVAVTFYGEYKREKDVYATYVSFNPGVKNSFQEGIEWLEKVYVAEMHEGIILTDFDQQEKHFKNTVFGLDKVMAGGLGKSDEERLFGELGLYNQDEILWQQNKRVLIIQEKKEVYMGNKYNITGGNQGAVGDNAQASGFIQVSEPQTLVDLGKLAAELETLRQAAKQEASEADHDIAVGEIASAEEAAKKGDMNSVKHHLAKAGSWAFDVATKIGVALAVEAIKQSMKP